MDQNLQWFVVGLIGAGAVALLVRHFFPRGRFAAKGGAPCGKGCGHCGNPQQLKDMEDALKEG